MPCLGVDLFYSVWVFCGRGGVDFQFVLFLAQDLTMIPESENCHLPSILENDRPFTV